MDPDATLDFIRKSLVDFDKATNPDSCGAVAMEIADATRNLDEWLSKGGALPQAWERKS